MITLKDLIFQHNNNYGVNIDNIKLAKNDKLKTLSIVIPYYETVNTINLLLVYLYKSFETVKNNYPNWLFEVIIVDDGSIKYPANIMKEKYENLSVYRFKQNKGIGFARNYGFKKAKYDIIMFLDSDVLVSSDTILDHITAQSYFNNKGYKIITCGFFNFIHLKDFLNRKEILLTQELNDFRIHCIYNSTWIGCESDKKYIGNHYDLLKETNKFRNWPHGFYGPWILPNMVLGGLFTAETNSCKMVKGFDKNFNKYGFVETSLVSKLIACYGTYVVPIIGGINFHVEDKEVSIPKIKKDLLFQKAHKKYFDDYLNKTLKEIIL